MIIWLFPIIFAATWLRILGLSWTAIMILWDVIICGLYLVTYIFDGKTDNRVMSRREKLIFALVFVFTLCMTVIIMRTENEYSFYCSALLPIFTSTVWFIAGVMRAD